MSGGLRYRHIGSRAADQADSITARGYSVVELFATWQLSRVQLFAAVDNLFNAVWNEAQFATTSRLPGELAPVTELNCTPGAPRTIQVGLDYRFCAAPHRAAGSPDGPRRVRGEPLQLLPRPAHLDPRVRRALGVRRARHQGAARRHPPDAAGRPGPAHQRGARGRGPDRGAARLVVGAVRQRVGGRDQ